MAGLYSSRNAMAVRPRFAVEEMGPPQPYPSTQEVVQNFGQGVYRGAMFTPELLAEAALMARYPEPSDMAPEDFAAYMAMLEQQQQDAEMPAEGLFGQMVAPDVTDLMPGIGGALGAMYVPLRNIDLAKLTRAASGEVVDDLPRAFSALHDRMPRVEIDDSAMRQVVPTREWVETRNGTMMAPSIGGAYSAAASNLHPNAPVRVRRLYESDWLNRYGEEPIGQELSELPIGLLREGTSQQGMFNNRLIGLNEALTPQQAKPTLLHELQHAVQERGGFARGGSPAEFDDYKAKMRGLYGDMMKMDKATGFDVWLVDNIDTVNRVVNESGGSLDDVRKIYADLLPPKTRSTWLDKITEARQIERENDALMGGAGFVNSQEGYRRLAGEIEARDTAARINMNAMARARTQPYTGMQVRPDGTFGPAYDIGGNIPLEDYIVRMK